MSGRLAAYVHVSSPEGEPVVLGPDSDLPDWAAAAIPNPKAWAEMPQPEVAKEPTNAEPETEIGKRNQGRADEGLITPASTPKADLVAALAADDVKSSAKTS